jgi:penicillin-binding protein-related factor A (putative recombinase)
MKKLEAKYQTIWNHYASVAKFYGYFETKYTETNTFNLRNIRENQWVGLKNIQENGLCIKYSDLDIREKACDSSNTPPLTAYLIIVYTNVYYAIELNKILEHKENNKSITEKEARLVATKIVVL